MAHKVPKLQFVVTKCPCGEDSINAKCVLSSVGDKMFFTEECFYKSGIYHIKSGQRQISPKENVPVRWSSLLNLHS